MIDQTECARAWAKVLAYKRCGQEGQARAWMARLCEMLGYAKAANVLDANHGHLSPEGAPLK